MRVYFENQSGEVIGTINVQHFNLEAAGSYLYIPSFIVAMPDGTFKVVDLKECRHELNIG